MKSAKAILAVAANENRDLNDGEQANHYKTLKALESLEAEIIAEERVLEAERNGEAVLVHDGAAAERGETVSFRPENHSATNDAGRPGKCKYEDLFGKPAKGAFASFGEFAKSVAQSRQLFDPRLKMAGTESSPGSGGFVVPPDQAATVWDQVLEREIVRPRSTVVPMSSDSRKWPYVVDKDHSGGVLLGTPGMAAGWSSELSDLDEADMEVGLMTLTASKFGLLHNASNELLEDSVYGATLSRKFQEGAAWHLDNAFLFGDGAGKPRGALSNHNALVVVNKEGTQAADTFIYENACALYSAMAPASLNNAVWLFTSSLVPQLLKMQNVVKNVAGTENVGGSAVPVLNIAPNGSMTLLTRPVIITEKLSAPGDQGDCAFVDFSQYCVGLRRDIVMESSQHAGWKNYSTWFRLTCRVDGQPLWADTLKLKNGATVSPFVVLQAR